MGTDTFLTAKQEGGTVKEGGESYLKMKGSCLPTAVGCSSVRPSPQSLPGIHLS